MPRKRKPDPTFFLDASLGGKLVAQALRAVGATVILHDDVFAPGTPDTTWLAEAGRRGWVVLTKDEAIRRNPLEKQMFRDYRVRVFVLTRKNLRGDEMAGIFAAALPRMLKRARGVPPPFMFSIARSGAFSRLE